MNIAVRDLQHIEVESGVRLAVRVSGAADKPAIVLSNSLASDMGMYDEVAERLAADARLIRYDTRGHGLSDAPEGGYSIERLGRDVIAILDTLKIARAVVCGTSLGGLTAMWLGIHAADRVSGLIPANTAANFPPATMWRERAATVRASGVDSLVQGSLERWVTADYRAQHSARVEQLAQMIRTTAPAGYAGCCEVLAETNLLPELAKIACPVRVIAGRHDPSTPPSRGEEIVSVVKGASLVTLEAAHISAVEAPDAFAAAVREFLSSIEKTNKV
ncbi:3-oxoadipate enol-lactonase [Afipia sp. TerB]